MKKLIKTVSCLIIVIIAFLALNVKNDGVVEYSTTSSAKTYLDPAPNYINRIDILLDEDKAKISPAYTYSELKHSFENNWSFPDGTRLRKGNNNIYFYTCDSSSLCEKNETNSVTYSNTVDGTKYHWVLFEIYTKDCTQGSDFCENDFDESNLENVEVYFNNQIINNAIVTNYNDYWHSVDVFIPMAPYTGPLVREVEVTTPADYVEKGTNAVFSASIKAYGPGTDSVTWTVLGANSANTTISSAGVLSVAADETAGTVTVRATSTYDNTIYGEKRMYIIDEPLSIDSVTIIERDKTVVYGGSYQFSATVLGTANHDVTWSLTGANKVGTSVSADGTVTVAADETSSSLILTATSNYDNTKHDSVTIITRATEFITKIEINYDEEEVIFSNKTTYNEVKSKLKRFWSFPDNAPYDEGNNNIWINYCPTAERCTDDDMTGGYSENMLLGRYTYVDFEIFAKPTGSSYMSNPEYDFDENHLDDIEIWINGVKRDDAYIKGYNDAWREVDVFVPITVTNAKLNQEFEFNYESYDVEYGADPFTNSILSYNHVGDGEITFTSSNPSVATVDNNGEVTIKGLGTTSITASASETEDYKPFSNSYTITVSPRYVHPYITINGSGYTYTGSEITPDITVTINSGETVLEENTDYTVSYIDNTNIGYGRVYIHPVVGSTYTFGETSQSFYINRRSISDANVTLSQDSFIYDGSAKEPTVSIVVEGRTLIKDQDYQITYSNNTNVGTAYIYIDGINNYLSNTYTTFEITAAPSYTKGDLNGDGTVNLPDVIRILRIYLDIQDPTETDNIVGDMNEDDELNLLDVIAILRVYLGID